MELRHLRYFVAVAELENVSRAALKLHVSQPALSRQIRDLEDEIGFPLLQRTAKSVSLTDAGRVFLTEARALLQQADAAVKKARAAAGSDQAELHVGYSPTPTARILPLTLREFQAAMPKVRVKLHDLSNQENLAALRVGTLNLAFVILTKKSGSMQGVRFEELSRNTARLAVSPAHPLASRDLVTLEEAVKEPFVAFGRKDYPDYHESFDAAFAKIKQKPRIVEEHDGVSSLIAAIEAGRGVALVGETLGCVAGPRLKLLRLEPEPELFTLGIAAPKGNLSSAAEQFWHCAKQAAQPAES